MVDTTFTRALARNSAKPNFLVLWDEAAGLANLSSYSDGLVGYRTDNIDRIADEGIRFTDAYGEQCSAGGRIAFSTGQYPCRVSKETLNRAHPTIATLLSQQDYATWHFGDRRNGGRSETITNAMAFMIAACIARQPFYCWVSLIQPPNASHRGTMVEHDDVVGELLDFLDERGLSDHTIVLYASGSGPQRTGCIDVGATPFRVGPGWCGEGTYRVPLLMRWPGVVPAGEVSNEVVHHTDFFPTLLAITGDVDVRTRLRRAQGDYVDPIHLDGQNLFPYLRGDDSLGPRSNNIYFSIAGEVMGLRVGDWKCVFDHGRAERPWFRNLRGDPFERDELIAPIERWQEQDGLGVIGQAVLADFAEVLSVFPPVQALTAESLQAALDSLSAAAAHSIETGATAMNRGWIGTGVVETRFGDFDFVGGFPTAKTARRLFEMRTFNRALEVYAEQMPGVSMFQIRKGLAAFGAHECHQVVVWKTLMDARTELLTGNSETVYAIGFLDLKRDGPTVIDVPAGMLGGLSEMWQSELIAIGPTGADKGKGGKFLILPPDYHGTPPAGYILATSETYGVMVGLRGFLVDGQPEAAVGQFESLTIYPLARAATPPTMMLIDGSQHDIETVFEDNYNFYEDLAELIDEEPADAIPAYERFHLASIGIEKGKAFLPDLGRRQLLADAACLASAIARTNTFASNDAERLVYPDRRWEWAFLGGSAEWDTQGFVNSDRRAAFAYAAIGMSAAMVRRVIGQGSQYLWTMRDGDGKYLDGGRTYRLRLPSNIPVAHFWSVVVYDPMSRSMLKNGQRFPSVSQYTNPTPSDDGSIEIYFGPRMPNEHAANWIETQEQRGWFALLRFYGPTKPFFDKTWKPSDIELLD